MSRCFPYPQPGHQRISEPLAAAAKSIKISDLLRTDAPSL